MNDLKEKAIVAMKQAKKPGTMAGLKPRNVGDIIKTYRSAIAQAIPKHLTADRIIQQATTLISRNPELAECSVESLLGATMQASVLGFQPVSALGQCYFVPFKNKKTGRREVQFIIGYRGYIDLARRTNEIKTIYAYPVYENDEFEFELGLNPVLKHIPSTGNRGALTHAYAVAHFVNGGYAFEVATKDDIEKHRRASQAADSKYSPWNTWTSKMWVKTAVKELSKWLPLSVDIQKNISVDEGVVNTDSFRNGEIDPNLVEINPEPEPEEAEVVEPKKTTKRSPKAKKMVKKPVPTVKDMVDTALSVWNCNAPAAVRALNEKAKRLYGLQTIDDMVPEQIEEALDHLNNGDWVVPF